MNILITGGTGLIGRRLCRVLSEAGHELTVLSRYPQTVAAKCGGAVHAMASLDEWGPSRHFDAVINLAGEPIVDHAWSPERKRALYQSRVGLTAELVRRIGSVQCKPAVLLSGSAIGCYGNRGDLPLEENAGAGSDFAAQLCSDWEHAALAAEGMGVRVCLLRTGLVLSGEGGLLGRMLLPFRLGLGARLGDGRQWMSWIHIDDYVSAVLHLLQDAQARGPYNMTAPHAETNTGFTLALAQAVRRPAWFVVPAMVLRIAMGERAAMLLGGQRVVPARLMAKGFKFRFAHLACALSDLLEHRH